MVRASAGCIVPHAAFRSHPTAPRYKRDMRIHVNDQPRETDVDTSLHDLLRDLGLADEKAVAVAVNGSVVSRATWSTRVLEEADRVLVIRATQGG